jgi:2-phospho-L-lactate transferase/gluconeogenesis factor (CofD/UPF0052 family)
MFASDGSNIRAAKPRTNKKAAAATRNAKAIVFGAGDLYRWLLPCFRVKGSARALRKACCPKVMVLPETPAPVPLPAVLAQFHRVVAEGDSKRGAPLRDYGSVVLVDEKAATDVNVVREAGLESIALPIGAGGSMNNPLIADTVMSLTVS